MNLIDDPLDALLDELVSDAGTIAASIDPVRIRTSAPDMKPRRISVWTGVVFAAAVAALLAIALGAGFVHQKSITPVTHSKKPFGTPATVSPFVLTPDPDDPGWACKEGTGESGSGGQMEMIQTIVCMSTTVPKRGEGPFAEGLSNTQIAQDLNWSYAPDPGAPATPTTAVPKPNIPWKWTTDPEDPGWACRLWTVEAGPVKSAHLVWALECRASGNSPSSISPLDQGVSNTQLARDLDWASIPANTERVEVS